MVEEAYFDKTARARLVEGPVVIDVEGDKAEYGNVKENLPARNEAGVGVEELAEIGSGDVGRKDSGGHSRIRVATSQLVGKEYRYVEDPGCCRNICPR